MFIWLSFMYFQSSYILDSCDKASGRGDSLTASCRPALLAGPVQPMWQELFKKSSVSRQMLVVHGVGHPYKILQDRYLAKLMVCRRISFANSYTTFKTRFSIKEHIISNPHLLTPGPRGVVGGVSVVFHVVAGWDQCGG